MSCLLLFLLIYAPDSLLASVHCSDGWDRTAQLAGLAQVMLDPFYRTIEGLFVLIQKEWTTFGHQFEHRCGKTTNKETSPVFLQFLDALYQLIEQFPSEFEYSSSMLGLLAHLCYSGLFITFMGNCERERTNLIRSARNNDEIDEVTVSFTSVLLHPLMLSNNALIFFCMRLSHQVYVYIRLLLYSSSGEKLVNPHYIPPGGDRRRVHYLRPKYAVGDLHLWKEGLLPGYYSGRADCICSCEMTMY